MAQELTETQAEILTIIVEIINKSGIPPSIREIQAKFNFASLRGVTCHLDALQNKKYITRTNAARSITVLKSPDGNTWSNRRDVLLPIYAVGADPNSGKSNDKPLGYLSVSQDMIDKIPGTFAVKVFGDSMIGAHICEGDILIIRPQIDANNGDIVVCTLDDEGFIKTYQKGVDGNVSLISENPKYRPIEVRSENSHIYGKMMCLIRNSQ